MQFHLTDEQQELSDSVDRYLQKACALAQLRQVYDDQEAVRQSIWTGLCELGFAGVRTSEEFGGLGLSLFDAALIGERLGWWAAPGPWFSHTLVCLAISEGGSDRQKKEWLPRLATGEIVGTVAFGGPQGWEPDAWTFTAEQPLTGVSDYVLDPGPSGLALVGLAGGRLGLAEIGSGGVEFEPWNTTDKTRPVGALKFAAAKLDLLQDPIGQRIYDAGAVLLAADALGGSGRMLTDIVDYSATRIQFGRPIAAFQAVKHKLADLAVRHEPNAPLTWHAAREFDASTAEVSSAASLAKAHLTETFSDIARAATESYGGMGYTWEHWAHIWLKRSLLNWTYWGAPASHRKRYARCAGW